ncbi:embryonic polarity protein dorsal isoform X2 [Culex pipiens pallens]|nr:embryonic polarity protein dorsal isoform X2 [Culex pipiens pallens]XP_039437555.1 embryonic polarity protein dorsal isoform X2 [Culex pipiens pallens]
MGPAENIVEDEPSLPDLPKEIIEANDLLDLISHIIQSDMPPTAPEKPYVVITEQPQSKALRFRYECEGRSAGSIPGVHSTPEQKTFPSIEVRGYKGRAVVVVSCVTKDPPYRPHPHNLVGKEGCKKGVCTVEINSASMSYTFSNLGIQCVKKKDIEEALRLREEIRVDPFKTGYSHAKQPATIDLNAVRLCFQVFLEGQQRGRFTEPLQPVVSDVIYDKKAMSDLVICKLSDACASVAGGKEIILLCEKVAKEDISVRFYEEQHGHILWEDVGEFQHSNVHKQVAISFRTPRYRTLEIEQSVMVNIQLRRPSDGATSEPLPFELFPLDSGRRRFWSLQKDILKNDSPENEVFKKILLEGSSGAVATKKVVVPQQQQQEDEVIVLLDTPLAEDKPIVAEQMPSEQKTTEWIERNEFDDGDNSVNASVDNQLMDDGGSVEQQVPKEDEDKTLNELLEQVAELDEIYEDHQLRRENMIFENELKNLEKSVPTGLIGNGGDKMDIDDVFDDAATYTSLQRAFKNPVSLALGPPVPPRPHNALELEPGVYDAVEPMLICPPSIEVSSLKRENKEDEKLPPLPPKRAKPNGSQNKENAIGDTGDEVILHSIIRKGSMRSLTPRPQSDQIIIMKSPDSPPNKKLPPTPPASPNKNEYGTLPKNKKPGFFSKLFSRKKSKSDLSASTTTLTQKDTPGASKEPSLANFEATEATRKNSEKRKAGKPVARSVSSVSCKRPSTDANPDVIYIPLKGDGPSTTNLTSRTGNGSGTHLSLPGNDSYERASTASLPPLDRKTVSALQLDVPIQDGNLELVAIADARSIKNLVEGDYGIKLDPSVDLTEAEHFALYTSIAPNAALSEFDETSCYYAPVEPGPLPQQPIRLNSNSYSADV